MDEDEFPMGSVIESAPHYYFVRPAAVTVTVVLLAE
jgi:hypothetical protein